MYSKLFYLVFTSCVLIFPTAFQAQSCGNLSLSDITNPGQYSYSSINQNDGIRNGPDYGNATIYFPTNATPPFASVAIVPGFVSAQSSVAAWGPFLASHGIVSIIIDTNSGFDFPSVRAEALLDALETLRQENTRTGSPLLGDLDTNRFAVMGWSMGGGGAQLAAVRDPSIKAVIALCPWLNGPTSGDLNHQVPVLIFSGELDGTAPPNQHANVHYTITPPTTDKLLFEIDGGGHSIANNPANAQGEIGRYGLAWLRNYLLDDACYCPLVLQPSPVTSENFTNIICPSIVACPAEISLPNQPIADGSYQAAQTIISMGTVPAGGIVSLSAGQSICLEMGSAVDLGAEFEAYIESCE